MLRDERHERVFKIENLNVIAYFHVSATNYNTSLLGENK